MHNTNKNNEKAHEFNIWKDYLNLNLMNVVNA